MMVSDDRYWLIMTVTITTGDEWVDKNGHDEFVGFIVKADQEQYRVYS